MIDWKDEDHPHLDETTPDGEGRSSPSDLDELALHAFVHSALRTDRGPPTGSTRIDAIEDKIRTIERGGLHPVEVAIGSLALLIALLIGLPIVIAALGNVAERAAVDGGTVVLLVAAGVVAVGAGALRATR